MLAATSSLRESFGFIFFWGVEDDEGGFQMEPIRKPVGVLIVQRNNLMNGIPFFNFYSKKTCKVAPVIAIPVNYLLLHG